jgi:hypothetical protein
MRQIGIGAYIRKPFVKSELLKTIRKLLDGQEYPANGA